MRVGDSRARVRLAYELALGRPPSPDEIREVRNFVDAYRESLQGTEQVELKAWAGFCKTLLTRNEFLFVD